MCFDRFNEVLLLLIKQSVELIRFAAISVRCDGSAAKRPVVRGTERFHNAGRKLIYGI
jgi:hypothetical protein